jgi:hypothetical protein
VLSAYLCRKIHRGLRFNQRLHRDRSAPLIFAVGEKVADEMADYMEGIAQIHRHGATRQDGNKDCVRSDAPFAPIKEGKQGQ